MKDKNKKIVAREFLFILVSSFVLFLISTIWFVLESGVKNDLQELQLEIQHELKNIDSLAGEIYDLEQIEINRTSFRKLYRGLNGLGLVTETFEEFDSQKIDTAKQDKIFELVIKDRLYTKSKVEFLEQFFPFSSQTLEVKAPYNLIDDELMNDLFRAIDNYASRRELFEIIDNYYLRTDENYESIYSEKARLEDKIGQVKSSLFNKGLNGKILFELSSLVLTFLMGMRYIYFATRWSINQLKS
ncbi:MAG: hypothetical protein H8D23_27190 [Candidatus Brocadiales bacterium]|nr:hypothetical protein [Candidatus Brocadiales bacterium]